MRPPEFTGGNISTSWQYAARRSSFNEAAGIHRRKHVLRGDLKEGTG